MEHVTGSSYYAEQVEPDRGGVVGWLTESRVTGLEILTCTLQLFTRDLTVAQSNEVGRDQGLGAIGCRRPATWWEGGGAWLLPMRLLYQAQCVPEQIRWCFCKVHFEIVLVSVI